MRCIGVVRICLAFALFAATSVSIASACPPLATCEVEPKAPEPAKAVIDAKLPAPKRAAPGEVEMPWIWQSLRERVYSRMPSYKEEKSSLAIVVAPVVVKSPSDTVPGIGISGDF